jgi:peptide/nickel transport system substrate-binding protein
MPDRRHLLASAALGALGTLAAGLPQAARAQPSKDTLVLGMILEPPGLDPTAGAASSIGEIVHYNVFETLTRIRPDGSVAPLLAERWDLSADGRTVTFRLRDGVRFHNGAACTAETVKFAFARAAAEASTNKDKALFAGMERIEAPDARTLVLSLRQADPDLLFLLGQATAAVVEPGSAAGNATQPVGTGPYRFERWNRGASVTLVRWDGHRDAAAARLRRATFRFIPDAAAQVAALLAGDVDAFPRLGAVRSLAQFRADPRFQVLVSNSRAKTLLAINQRKKPLDDVRVRRAIAAAIDRKAVIAGAAEGLGVPIGSHYVPGAPGYVDTTGVNPYDPARARALLQEAGVTAPLALSLKLPPPPYARVGGEIVAAQLAQVGIVARIENVEWAQWLGGVYNGRNYDLTIISHVEPFDLGNYAKRGYYWGYESARFDALYARILAEPRPAERAALLAEAQRLLAADAANAWLYQPQWPTVADRRLAGLWKDMPVFVNELAALHWT